MNKPLSIISLICAVTGTIMIVARIEPIALACVISIAGVICFTLANGKKQKK
jgi:energy-converting hydrogenase Eha subunit C